MKKIFVAGALALSFCSYGFAEASVKDDIIGTWAMSPLKNGIANVVEFKTNNITYNHDFTCDWGNKKVIKEGVEKSTYAISGDLISITLDGKKEPYTTLKFKGVKKEGDKTILKLAQIVDFKDEKLELDFSYTKTDKIQPLCPPYFEKE